MVDGTPFFPEFVAADTGVPGLFRHQVPVGRGMERLQDRILGFGVEIAHGEEEGLAVPCVEGVHEAAEQAGGHGPFGIGFNGTSVFGRKMVDEKMQDAGRVRVLCCEPGPDIEDIPCTGYGVGRNP